MRGTSKLQSASTVALECEAIGEGTGMRTTVCLRIRERGAVRRGVPGIGVPSVSVTGKLCPFTTSLVIFIPLVTTSIRSVRAASGLKMF